MNNDLDAKLLFYMLTMIAAFCIVVILLAQVIGVFT